MSTSLALSGTRLQELPSSKTPAEGRRTLRARVLHDRLAFAALIFLGLLIVLAAGADLLATSVFRYTATQQNLLEAYARPDLGRPALWLGTDEFGRSVVVR